MYAHAAGALIDGVLKMMIRAILTVGDLSVEDSEALPAVLKTFPDDLLGQVIPPTQLHFSLLEFICIFILLSSKELLKVCTFNTNI